MNNLKKELHERVSYIAELISNYMPKADENNKKLIEAMSYSIFAGGKRIRPIFMLEAFKICRGESNAINSFLVAIEMIHTYSLIHDDLPAMDNDELRRGMPTCHIKYGEDIAILAGDALLNRAFEIITKDAIKNKECMIIDALYELSKASGANGMIGGQAADIMNENKLVDIELLEYIHLNKTSALIEAAFVIGAILAKASTKEVETFRKIGRNIGLAFQIQDDLLDVLSTDIELGKPTKSDEKNSKATYVTIKGIEESTKIFTEQLDEAILLLEKFDKETSKFLVEYIKYLKDRKY